MQRLFQGLLIVAAAAAVGLAAGPAGAYAVYNKSKVTVFAAGEDCTGCFAESIPNDRDASCPGDKQGCRGTTWISWSTKDLWDMSKKGAANAEKRAQNWCANKSEWEEWKEHFSSLKAFLHTGAQPPMYYCPHKVPAHGWVTIKGDKADRCHVKDEHGKVLYDGPVAKVCGIKED